MNDHLQYQPVPTSQRLMHLDVLRGAALLGILLVNFQWFTRPLQAMWFWPDTALTGADNVINILIMVFAEGKFYPLFALLFGAGYFLMADRAVRVGVSGTGIYCRRFVVLAVFGLAHIVLFWPGDILLFYACTALIMLLLFRNTPVRRLWKWALAGLLMPLFAVLLLSVGMWADEEFADEVQSDMQAELLRAEDDVVRANPIFESGSFAEAVSERLISYAQILDGDVTFSLLTVLGYFLLGRWLAASGRLLAPAEYPRFYRRWASVGTTMGIGLTALSLWLIYRSGPEGMAPVVVAAHALLMVAGFLMALGYLAWIVRLSVSLRWLAPVGRMALSHYLLQSIFWTSVFYGYGLGLWGQVPRAWHPVLVVLFFAGQVWLSHWWLQRYHYGPAEWLWRALTYWQRPPMKR